MQVYNLLPIVFRHAGILETLTVGMVFMSTHATLRVLVTCCAMITASSAAAQIFKWVDENGVTTYSNQRPANANAAGDIEVVENRISVYTPDAALLEAVDTFRQQSNRAGANAAAPQERPSGQYAAPVYVPVPVAPDPCADEGSAYCNEMYTGYYPYAPAVGHRVYRRYKRVPQIRLRPGTIAGQVVGMDGYIPGNSANARRYGRGPMHSLSRPALEPRSTGGRRPVQLPSRFR